MRQSCGVTHSRCDLHVKIDSPSLGKTSSSLSSVFVEKARIVLSHVSELKHHFGAGFRRLVDDIIFSDNCEELPNSANRVWPRWGAQQPQSMRREKG
jgi:enamine deaminase RidA (YjgF/YER057c/UK114 family)